MHAQSCLTPCDSMDCSPPWLLCPLNFPGKNTGVACHFLLQRMFLTQSLNLCLLCFLNYRWILYCRGNWEAPEEE